MLMVSRRSGFAITFALAVFGVDARAVHAQALPYWTSTWPPSLSAGYGGSDAAESFSSRYNLPNGWFVCGERGGLGLTANSFSPGGAWGSASFAYEGVQFGYNFKSAPVTVYAGFDTLKYNTGIASPLAGFDSSSSSSAPGYGAHAGVEFRPTSNLSLSLGVGFAQQGGRLDSDINSSLPPGATPLYFGGRR